MENKSKLQTTSKNQLLVSIPFFCFSFFFLVGNEIFDCLICVFLAFLAIQNQRIKRIAIEIFKLKFHAKFL
jgi:uncharacterized membrane protein YjjP (DUF1212 family)